MEERRGAQRLAVPKPVPATFGGFDSKIVEISEIGCQITHGDRITPKSKLALKFKWRGTEVRIEGTIVRSELRFVAGKPAYQSGIEFCRTVEDSPAVIREIVAWLAKASGAPEPPQPAPAPPPVIEEAEEVEEIEEIEALSADYLQCVFANGRWMKLYVGEAAQPANGFTIPAPADEREADVLCRAFEKADANKRKAMRAQFEQAIKQQRRA